MCEHCRTAINTLERADRDPRLLEKSFVDAGNAAAKSAEKAFDALQQQLPGKLQGHLDDLIGGKITGARAAELIGGDLRKAHSASYLLGKERMLGKAASLSADDLFYLDRAMGAELKFLDGFIADIVNGITGQTGHMAAGARLDLYSRGVRGSHNNARVEYAGGGRDDVEVLAIWELDIAEHCTDCLSLSAMNPWTKESIPCTPGSGDTQCGGKCKCHLRFETRPKKTSRARDLPIRPRQARDVWTLPTPPKGLALPSQEQRLAIESLRQEINVNRRLAQDLLDDGEDLAAQAALGKRRAANATLNQYLRDHKLWSPPAFGLDDVLSGKILDDKVVDALLSIGTDGPTLATLSAAEYRRIIREIVSGIPELKSTIKSTLLMKPEK